MSKDYRKEIKELIHYLNKQAKESKKKDMRSNPDFTRGLEMGYAGAYELCAKWLHEILEEA